MSKWKWLALVAAVAAVGLAVGCDDDDDDDDGGDDGLPPPPPPPTRDNRDDNDDDDDDNNDGGGDSGNTATNVDPKGRCCRASFELSKSAVLLLPVGSVVPVWVCRGRNEAREPAF